MSEETKNLIEELFKYEQLKIDESDPMYELYNIAKLLLRNICIDQVKKELKNIKEVTCSSSHSENSTQ
jgi:hypothetical protein